MLYKTSVPVRFDADTKDRLEAISQSTGLNVSDLVRFATQEYLQRTEERGQVLIPFALCESPDSIPTKPGKSHKVSHRKSHKSS